MKTKELIKLLQEEDPEGTCDVAVGNLPITFIERLPYYYDGRLQFIEMNSNNKPIRAGWKTDCSKIQIHYTNIEKILLDHPELPIETSGASKNDDIEKIISEWRQAGKRMQAWSIDLDEQIIYDGKMKK